MRILITGITGFAGSHLADYLLENEKDVEIFGIKRWRSRTETIEHIKSKVELAECDLRDLSSVKNLIESIMTALRDFGGGAAPEDDRTVVAIAFD